MPTELLILCCATGVASSTGRADIDPISVVELDPIVGPAIAAEAIDALIEQTFPAATSLAVKVSGSSHSAWRDKVYRPSNTIDRNHRTAWVEGVRGHGVGEWIDLSLEPPSTDAGATLALLGVVVLPGFAKNAFMFVRNDRPRALRAEVTCASDGDPPARRAFRLRLRDACRPQLFRFDDLDRIALRGHCAVRLTIESVYAGTHYKDTSIAEVRLLAGPAN